MSSIEDRILISNTKKTITKTTIKTTIINKIIRNIKITKTIKKIIRKISKITTTRKIIKKTTKISKINTLTTNQLIQVIVHSLMKKESLLEILQKKSMLTHLKL